MTEVLVDTSVWVDHFRRSNESLVDLPSLYMTMIHSMIVTDLACGTPLVPRTRTLADIATLLHARQASLTKVRELIERERLFGLRCGVMDLTLLASTMVMTRARLWTSQWHLRHLTLRFDNATE